MSYVSGVSAEGLGRLINCVLGEGMEIALLNRKVAFDATLRATVHCKQKLNLAAKSNCAMAAGIQVLRSEYGSK